MTRAVRHRVKFANRRLFNRQAAYRRFFATGERLEPRDLLYAVTPVGSSTGQFFQPMTACTFCDTIAWVGNAWAATSDFLGSFEGQTGDLSVTARSSASSSSGSSSERSAYLPSYSTRDQRSLIAAVNIEVPAATNWTSLEVETTFNSIPNTVYYDPSGIAALGEFQVSDLLDASGLAPGRYPFHMDFVADISGGGTDTFDYDGHVLVSGTSDSLLSSGWQIALDRLSFDGDGAIWDTGDGNLYWFDEVTGTYFGSAADLDSHTLEVHSGIYTIADRFGNETIFDAHGLLTEKLDRFGNSTLYHYTNADGGAYANDIEEIESFDGTSTTFAYDTSSPYLLQSITDFDGLTVTVDYNGSGELESLTHPDPGASGDPLVVGYTYNATTHLLDTVTEGYGAGAKAYTTEFTYDPISQALTSIERPDGTVENYVGAWTVGLGGTNIAPATAVPSSDVAVTKTTIDGNGTADLTTSYYLGAFGRVKKIVDPLGNITQFTLDGYGRVTKRIDPDPDSIGSGQPAPETDYGYDIHHNLTSMELPDGTDLSWTYNANWNIPDSYTNELGLVTLYDVNNSTGNIDSIRQVIGNVDDGYNLETDDIVTEFTYYALGTPGTDPPAGLVETMTDGEGRITSYDYNPRGNPTQIVYASGTADEAEVNIHYAGLSTPDYIDDELDRRTDFEYDNLLRLTKTILPPPDSTAPTVRPEYELVYDVHDRIITTIDALDRETYTTYDKRSRVIKTEQPDHDEDTYLTTTEMTYSKMGLLTSTKDPLDRLIAYTYDNLGRQTFAELPEVADPTTAVNEVQVIDFDSGTEGTFKLNGNSTYATVDLAKLNKLQENLDTIWGQRNTVVTYTSTEATITFKGAFAATNVAPMTISNISGTKGATPFVDPDTDGQAADMVHPLLETQYDNLGRVIKTIDALLNETTYKYENFGNKVTITLPDPDGAGTDYESSVIVREFDPAGNLTKETDANLNTTEWLYDQLGRLISVTTPDPDAGGDLAAATTTNTYDKANNLIETTDSVGNVYGYFYDNRDRLTKEVHPDPDGLSGPLDAPEIEYEFNDASELTKVTDALDRVTEYEHDGLGNVIKVTLPDPDKSGTDYVSPVVEYTFDLESNLLTIADALLNVTEMKYDALDNMVERIDPDPDAGGDQLSAVTYFEYDAVGQLLTKTQDFDYFVDRRWEWVYDNLGRVISEFTPHTYGVSYGRGPETKSTYDLAGNLYSVTDPIHNTTNFTYDAVHRRTKTEQPDPDGLGALGRPTTLFGYDPNNNLTSLTDPVGNQTTWTLDTLNRVVQETNEFTDQRSYVYSQQGDLMQKIDRLDRVTKYFHDGLHRLTREEWWNDDSYATIDVTTTTEGALSPTIELVGFWAFSGAFSGTFTLTFDGQTTSTLAWNASAATVETALKALSNIGDGDLTVVKNGDSSTEQEWRLTFGGDLLGSVPQVLVNSASLVHSGSYTKTQISGSIGDISEEQVVTLNDATGGTFTLSFGGQTTTALAWDAADTDVDAALEALSSIDTVDVSGSPGGPYTITFTDSHAGVNVEELGFDDSGLYSASYVQTISYGYDAASQLTDVTDPNADYTYAYDDLGRVSQQTLGLTGYTSTITLNQLFNDNSLRTEAKFAFGGSGDVTQTYAYDGANRMIETAQFDGNSTGLLDWKRAQFSYYQFGDLAGILRDVGSAGSPTSRFYSTYYYHGTGLISAIIHGSLSRYHDFEYDDAGRLYAMESSTDGLTWFQHDDTNQVISADHETITDETFTYDENGNRTMARAIEC